MEIRHLFTRRENISGDIAAAWEILAEEFDLSFAPHPSGGREVIFEKGDALQVIFSAEKVRIIYHNLSAAVRGTGLALAQTETDGSEHCPFEKFGVMIDSSRNGVMNLDYAKKVLRLLALAGYNRVMLYTEDTYELPDEPHFGILRGRYTFEEIRELDEYAGRLGLELTGCIQTLGHLATFLRLAGASGVKDTASVMFAGEEKTYELIGKMLDFWSSACRSRTIHIGMDETHDLGRGKFMDKNGCPRNFDIFNNHLVKVCELCRQRGLQPMIWSDMYFRMGSKNGSYYDPEAVIPEDIKNAIPKDVSLVYWDYYHLEEDFYDRMILAHRAFDRDVAAASGLWTWARLSYDHRQSIDRAEPFILSARKNRIKDFFFTMWGDDGAYCGFDTALPGIIRSADTAWNGGTGGEEKLEKLSRAWHAGSYRDMLTASEMNYQSPRRDNGVGCCSILLWDDPLMGIGWRHLELDDAEICNDFEAALQRSCGQKSYPYAAAISEFLLAKLRLRRSLLAAYRAKDPAKLKEIAENLIPQAVDSCRHLAAEFRKQWVKNYKFAGMETCQHRFAGNIIRLEELALRIEELLNGTAESIPELEITADKRCSPVQEWHRDFAFSGVN